MRGEEVDGLEEITNTTPANHEAEMDMMFNQSILQGDDTNIGRLSITN